MRLSKDNVGNAIRLNGVEGEWTISKVLADRKHFRIQEEFAFGVVQDYTVADVANPDVLLYEQV